MFMKISFCHFWKIVSNDRAGLHESERVELSKYGYWQERTDGKNNSSKVIKSYSTLIRCLFIFLRKFFLSSLKTTNFCLRKWQCARFIVFCVFELKSFTVRFLSPNFTYHWNALTSKDPLRGFLIFFMLS